MEVEWPNFNAFLQSIGIEPEDCWLYRHSGAPQKVGEERLERGREWFLSFLTYQSRTTAWQLVKRRYTAHFLGRNLPERTHNGLFIGITECIGEPEPFDDDEQAIIPGYIPGEAPLRVAGDDRHSIGMRWVFEDELRPLYNRMIISWGLQVVRVCQEADRHEKTIVDAPEHAPRIVAQALPLDKVIWQRESTILGYEERVSRLHLRYERRGNVSSKVKREKGLTCEGCGLDALAHFGTKIATSVIDAHHKKPLSEMPDGRREPKVDDFLVLCANCHRLIHRLERPDDLAGLHRLLERTEN